MGNILPGLDADKKDIIEGIAKDFLATFSAAYVQAYGVEVARLKLNELQDEARNDPDEPKKELTYRESCPSTDPIKTGYMIKQGAVVKNWKKRFFVVRPDFFIDYYENQEAYEKGFKCKGSIIPAGYRVEEDADGSITKRLKELAKKLGADENDLPTPVKYPDHTFELFHDRRRAYYITADNDEEKQEWIKVIKECCSRCNGLKNPDPIARVAFMNAFKHARWESGYYYARCQGAEEQILSDTIVGAIDSRVMSDVYSNLSSMPGGYTVRRKVREQIVKSLDSLVMAMVIPSYKGQVETTAKMKGPIEDMIMSKKDEIVGLQKKITEQLADKLQGPLGVVMTDNVDKEVDTLLFKLRDIVTKCLPPLRDNVVKVLEHVINKAKDNDDIEAALPQYFRILDQAQYFERCRSKVTNIYYSCLDVLRNNPFLKEIGRGYTDIYFDGRHITDVVIDAAAFTFEELFKELVKGTDALTSGKTAAEIMTTCKDQVLPKYDADAKHLPDEVSFFMTRKVLIELLTDKLDPLTKDIRKELRSSLPEAMRKVVSVDERYENYIMTAAGDLVKKAIKNEESQSSEGNQENSKDNNPSTEL